MSEERGEKQEKGTRAITGNSKGMSQHEHARGTEPNLEHKPGTKVIGTVPTPVIVTVTNGTEPFELGTVPSHPTTEAANTKTVMINGPNFNLQL
jgi:hypothetical protein